MDEVISILSGQKFSKMFNGIRTKEYLEKIDCLDSVVVIGRKWFDKHYGNTYHTSSVYINGKFVKKSPMEYGYGECYLQTAHKILRENGYFDMDLRLPSGGDGSYQDFIMWGRITGRLINEAVYVATKKEL